MRVLPLLRLLLLACALATQSLAASAQSQPTEQELRQGFEICEAWLGAAANTGSVVGDTGWRRSSPDGLPADVSITYRSSPAREDGAYIVLQALRYVHAEQRSCNLVVRFGSTNDDAIIGAPRRLLEGAGFSASPHRSLWQDELWSRAQDDAVDIAVYVFGPTQDFTGSSVGIQVQRTQLVTPQD